jgi:hypothetical protein
VSKSWNPFVLWEIEQVGIQGCAYAVEDANSQVKIFDA